MTPEKLTLLPALVILAIVLLLGFWLFGKTSAVATELNDQGKVVQWIVAKLKAFFVWVASLFTKKATNVPAPPPSTPVTTPKVVQPMSEVLDNLPPKQEGALVPEVVAAPVPAVEDKTKN